MFKGFRDFVLRGNVVDLAVGVVIGAAFGTVVRLSLRTCLPHYCRSGQETGLFRILLRVAWREVSLRRLR